MLFGLQSSLDTIARKMATEAALTSQFPLTAEGIKQRCLAAANQINTLGPGYTKAVRQDFIQGLSSDLKNYNMLTYDEDMLQLKLKGVNTQLETMQNEAGSKDAPGPQKLRAKLASMGAGRPNGFWDGLNATNARHGGCFALFNPVVKQVTFHVVINSGCAWPVFLKGFYHFAGQAMNRKGEDKRGYCGWLEGKGSYTL